MADNDSYEKDMEEIFGETRGERERKRLEQISDAAAESVRLANDFKQELKKDEIQSDDPIIQKCLDIIRNPKAWVSDLADVGYYSVHIGNKEYFTFNKSYIIRVGTEYKITINWQDYKFGGERPDLEELHKLCVAKYKEQSQEREKNTLDFMNDANKGDKTKKTLKMEDIVFNVVMIGVLAAIITIGVMGIKDARKTQRVNKQVEAYEKTLPGYLEQKQAVEHYRDSLMHAKGR